MPAASPIAHMPSPACIRASTSMPRAARLDPDRLQAEARDARPPAGRDEQPVAAQLVAVGEARARTRPPSRRRGAACTPEAQLDRRRRASASPSASPSAAGSRGSTWSAPSTRATDAPMPRDRLRHLDPDGPAAEHEQPARDLGQAASPRGSSTRRRARADPAIGGTSGSEPVAITTCSARVAPRRRRRRAPGRRAGPLPRSRSMPLPVQPADLAGVVVAGDHEVAPRERLLDVDAPVTASRAPGDVARGRDRLAGSQQRLGRDAGAVGALARRRSSRSTIATRRPPSASCAGARLAARGRRR